MRITVSRTLDVPATLDLDAVEPLIVAEGRRAMVQAVRAVCREHEGAAASCPHGRSPLLPSEGTERRVLLCQFGRAELMVRRLRCEGCGARFCPAGPFLACLGGGNLTRTLREACALAGASWPYATAARVLRALCGAQVSAETIRRVTRLVGEGAVGEQVAHAQEALAPVPKGADGPTGAGPDQLLVGLDGGWVASREQAGGMEGKVGVVATEVEALGNGRHRLSRRRYVATFRGAERLGALAFAAARALGGDAAKEQVALGDGAGWIKRQVDLHFPEAVRILDWPHLERCLRRAIRAARPGPLLRAARHRLYQDVFPALRRGDVAIAIELLQALRPPPGSGPIEALEVALTYLRNQRGWIGDYDAWKDAGDPVGSGMVERAVEIVINRRMKRCGMRWRRDSADSLVALRVRTLNQDWDNEAARRAA